MASMDTRGQIPPTGHPYAHINSQRPAEYWDYEKLQPDWGPIDMYEVSKKIGRGKYSEVFVGRNRLNGMPCAIKVLKPVKWKKIVREVKILQNLFGGPNIVRLLDIGMHDETQTPVLVFEHVNNTDFRVLYPTFTDYDVRYYVYQVLKALEFAHSMGIMHRDVKPHNIMIDHGKRALKLIDWGLAEFYHHGTPYNVRVASRYFKGPELLIDLRVYDYALDIWSLGCVLAGILFVKDPFFRGKDNADQLVQITRVLGTDGLYHYCEKYNVDLPRAYDGLLPRTARIPWAMFVAKGAPHLCNDDALDLLDKMLRYDHCDRIRVREAMAHPYFACVRANEAPSAPAPAPAPAPPAASSTGTDEGL